MAARNLPPNWAELPDEELLPLRMSDLPLRIEGTVLEGRIKQLQAELEARELRFPAHFYISSEWFTPDGTVSMAVPFYLTHPRLEHLEKAQMLEVEGGDHDGCMRILRHEAGHVIFGFAPDFLTIAAGSATQLIVPVLVAWLFIRQPDWFGVTVAGFWLGYSMINLSRYIGDARKKILILFGVGAGEPIHDWEYMLTRLGLLDQDRTIASIVRMGGVVVAVLSILAAAWMCLVMWQLRGNRQRSYS